MNNVRREVSRHFKGKKKAYLRDKIEEIETKNKIQNIRDFYRGINYFKKGYQPAVLPASFDPKNLNILYQTRVYSGSIRADPDSLPLRFPYPL